jgi:hypothetical protein
MLRAERDGDRDAEMATATRARQLVINTLSNTAGHRSR